MRTDGSGTEWRRLECESMSGIQIIRAFMILHFNMIHLGIVLIALASHSSLQPSTFASSFRFKWYLGHCSFATSIICSFPSPPHFFNILSDITSSRPKTAPEIRCHVMSHNFFPCPMLRSSNFAKTRTFCMFSTNHSFAKPR